MGKGSSPRPYSVPMDKFESNFEQIFGVKCKACGKNTKPGDVHTCSPQYKEELSKVKENEQS